MHDSCCSEQGARHPPALRIWVSGDFAVSVPIGSAMRIIGVDTVVEAGKGSGLSVDDHVSSHAGEMPCGHTLSRSLSLVVHSAARSRRVQSLESCFFGEG